MNSPKGRSLAEFGSLSSAEQRLLDACAKGEIAIAAEVLPTAKSDTNKVRADFVAFLAMGGDEHAPVHHQGVQLRGMWIEGTFRLKGAQVPVSLGMQMCHFESCPDLEGCTLTGQLSLRQSRVEGLKLEQATVSQSVFLTELQSTGKVRLLGAQIGGVFACQKAKLDGKEGDALSMDRAVVNGSVFLTELQSTGQVRLLGAQIGGNLECQKAKLDGKEGDALSMDRAVVRGDVFLTELQSKGEVRLLGAQVGGNLECQEAKLDGKGGDALSMDGAVVKGDVFLTELQSMGKVRLLGAQIGGNLECPKAKLDGKEGCFSSEGAEVKGAWILRSLLIPLSHANLTGFRVGRLVDDDISWGNALSLDGFHYGSFGGDAPVDSEFRVNWLMKQRSVDLGNLDANNSNQQFKPQPWKQLQRVLHDTGHAEAARQVAIAFERHLRLKNLIGQSPESWNPLRRFTYKWASVFLHWTFDILVGYGYRPLRVVGWMALVWFLSASLYWFAALQGVMGPSNPLIFNDPKLATACSKNWYLCEKLPEEYTGFSPLVYSLDLLLPVVNLEQEKDWAPLIPTPRASLTDELLQHWTLKHVTRMVVWLEILFGWVSSLLLVAVLSGLTKRRDE